MNWPFLTRSGRTSSAVLERSSSDRESIRGPLFPSMSPEEKSIYRYIKQSPYGHPMRVFSRSQRAYIDSLLDKGYLESYPPDRIRVVGRRMAIPDVIDSEDLDDLEDPLEYSADPNSFLDNEEFFSDVEAAQDEDDDNLILDLIDDIDEDDDTADRIYDAPDMETAYEMATDEIMAYADELGEDLGMSRDEIVQYSGVRDWVEDIRSGLAD